MSAELTSVEYNKTQLFVGGHGGKLMGETMNYAGIGADVVVPMFDFGGASRIRRINSHLEEPAFGDSVNIFPTRISHASREENPVLYDNFKFLMTDRDQREGVLGQRILSSYWDPETGFEGVHNWIESMGLELTGRLLPASTVSSHIVFETEGRGGNRGRRYVGEEKIDEQATLPVMIKKIGLISAAEAAKYDESETPLDRPVPAFPQALEAVRQADHLVIGPGTLYASNLPQFHTAGMREAVAKSKAHVSMIIGGVSTRNTDHEWPLKKFVDVVHEHTGVRPTTIVIPSESPEEFHRHHPDVAGNLVDTYQHVHVFESYDIDDVEKDGVAVYRHDAMKVVDGEVKFDPEILAEAIKEINPTSSTVYRSNLASV
jgi:uncharacterized cofD-like protein